MSEYIIEWSGIGARIVELMGSVHPCLIVKRLREERRREEIVRCRECMHYDPHCTDDGVCFLPDGDGDFARWEVKPDGFCAWGERRNS